ncbi:MAG: hypothetical protein NTZ28_13050, partial [Nitrospirae bacterium]|nr:hypothetical protein [Nitrospirota bacterium]
HRSLLSFAMTSPSSLVPGPPHARLPGRARVKILLSADAAGSDPQQPERRAVSAQLASQSLDR